MAEESVVLPAAQARAVFALAREQQEIQREFTQAYGLVMQAIDELGKILATQHQLPTGEGVTYRFAQDGENIKLVAQRQEGPVERVEETD